MPQLTVKDHSRVFSDFTYIYPVVSRRAQGVSLGINLNVNNACNWRCVYCQVEGLVRGKPESIDLVKLESELDYMLNWLANGDFVEKYAPRELRRFSDICLSGNGESTMSHQFLATIEIIAKLRSKYNLTQAVKTILISNGSEIDRPDIQEALKLLSGLNGEVWFKVDSATKSGMNSVNQVILSIDGVKKRLLLSTTLCKTYIQTCMFQLKGQNPSVDEVDKYIDFVTGVQESIAGVLLYSTARNPALPEGHDISSVSEEFLAQISNRLIKVGVLVKYYQ
jgi:wyosine [tRNA(Phe)-imidazoG37] synthetase (radical SAM superfamily)